VSSGWLQRTGENAGCVSNYGTSDMVGNLWESVADWVPPQAQGCGRWLHLSDDMQCLGNGTSTNFSPTAPHRGGGYAMGALAGPFAINSHWPVMDGLRYIGFRGAR
jgi:formylglycine-generating enzyme required for sulfatase activity